MKTFVRWTLLSAVAAVLASCATQESVNPYALDSAAARSRSSEYSPAPERPGLGTKWGEDRDSRVVSRDFSRGGSGPYGTGKVFYNDEAGAKAMAMRAGYQRYNGGGPVEVARGTVSVGLTNGGGSYLQSYASGGDRFYIGEHGDRYQIKLRNLTDIRVEVVVSVDGLDVMDGKAASTSKRGYLIPAGGSLTIDGFRQSESKVAAFRFGSVSQSYAQTKHGDSRNVGVIGVAVYTEHGENPWDRRWSDARVRGAAKPFADRERFATPPR